jgi:hypothetical protein
LIALSKKRILAVALVLALIVPLMGQSQVRFFVLANPVYLRDPPTVSLTSPAPMQTINSTFAFLKVHVSLLNAGLKSIPDQAENVRWMHYYLDGQIQTLLSFEEPKVVVVYDAWVLYSVDSKAVFLPHLSDGTHTLVLEGETTLNRTLNLSTHFMVNTAIPNPSSSTSPLPSPTTTPLATLAPTTESTSTPEPTSTPKPQSGFLGTNLPTEYGYAMMAVLIIIAGLSLFIFKKRKLQKVQITRLQVT